MTREEAIDVLKHNYPSSCYEDLCEAVEIAIKALEQPEPCEDTISRQAAIDALMKRDKELRNINWYDKPFAEGECKGIDDALEIINTLPSAQPERKMGRWILWNYPGEECAICSACGEEYDQMELYIGGNGYPKYCPNCGAAMRQPEDDIPMEYFENGGTV